MSERFNSNKKYDDMQQRAIKKGNTPIHSGFELLEIMLETRGRFIFGDLKFGCLCVSLNFNHIGLNIYFGNNSD